MKHTPAPWKYDGDCLITSETGDSENPLNAVLNLNGSMGGSLEEMEANSHLIAAAPELLAALKNLMNGIETGAITSDHDEVMFHARQIADRAISKAEGK